MEANTETEENKIDIVEKDYVELYSKRAIRAFSIFFSPIFGGVLLMLNLRRAGFKKEGNVVIAFCLVYMVFTAIVISSVATPGSSLTILMNLIGGMILTEYFFKKYFPDDDYYPRSVWKAVIVSLLITLPIAIAIIHYGGIDGKGLK